MPLTELYDCFAKLPAERPECKALETAYARLRDPHKKVLQALALAPGGCR